ncbi:MAG: glycosyltransferase family 2 protein [Bryobacteraceae bacterium]|jgi:glycosyltransferase involved in cell wall biosynthesis
MAPRLPRISIVTSSYNQGNYIGETIESVLAQNYPNVEHIVVDGMSTDDTPAVLARYPHLRVIREPDKGHGDAVNKGFRAATGEIYGFLNSDDTLLPGALERVAAEIDPGRGRHIVMGRCRFTDEHGRYTGIEHPSHFESFDRVLKIWKGHTIPQPAVFWTAEVWRECGPLEDAGLVLDYDLFCRFARRHRFHCVDQVLATYRLQPESKTMRSTEEQRLEDSIGVSRRYWESPFTLRYWRLASSLAAYRLNRQGRVHRLYLRAAQERRQGRWLRAVPYGAAAAVLGPELAFNLVALPRLQRLGGSLLQRAARLSARAKALPSQTAVYMDRTDIWSDGWAGPQLLIRCEAQGGEDLLVLAGWAELKYLRKLLVLSVSVDGELAGDFPVRQPDFQFAAPLQNPLGSGTHWIQVRASTWWAPHRVLLSGDYRPLSWRPAPEGVTLARQAKAQLT